MYIYDIKCSQLKIIKQKILYFSEGKSDKVYEVDLNESGDDLFVVNFRYGRRGANLREGTKTVFPVSFDEAESVFDKLVASKEKKGYHEKGVVVESKIKTQASKPNTAREKTILKYLKEANQGIYTRNWKISRIIYRAYALNMQNAIPFIEPFVNSEDEFEQYAAIYVLSAFNHKIDTDLVYAIFQKNDLHTMVGRIAVAYLLASSNTSYKIKIKELILSKILNEFEIQNMNSLLNSLAVYFMKEEGIDASLLYYIYLYSLDNTAIRKQLSAYINTTKAGVNKFKSIRYIYRASEILQDEVFLALVSKKIVLSKPMYFDDYYYTPDYKYINALEEKKKPNPSIAFSVKTKNYFNRATYKLVLDYSKNNTNLYVNYVKEIMSLLDDKKDIDNADVKYFYDYNSDTQSYESQVRHYPRYNNFLALMYIVYGNSTGIQRSKNNWYYTESVEEEIIREEILQEVWNKKPVEVLHILAHAKSEIAIQFSLGILKENKQFFDEITDSILLKLVSHYHEGTVTSVLDFLEEKYASSQPKEAVLVALLSSDNPVANEKAFLWLVKYEATYFISSDFMVKLLFTKNENVITYLISLFKDKHYNYPIDIKEIDDFFENPTHYSQEYLLKINELIGTTTFGKLLKATPETLIKKLGKSKVLTNKLFAANLSKHNEVPAFELFKDSFDGYINSDEPILRKVGIELLSHFPDSFLLENRFTIGAYCFSEHQEVREAILPSIERLIKMDNDFKESLLQQLISVLSEPEEYEGIHKNSYRILTAYYGDDLTSINKEGIFVLILSKYEFAQKLGLPLFKERVILKDLSIEALVALSTSHILEIREIVHGYFKNNIDRINFELEESLRIFHSEWKDVINWGIAYYDKHIKAENWTVAILLYLADHTDKKVQAFARKMITKHFSDDKGLTLLMKLQEHPTRKMQFFVTNYLDNYAKEKPEVILELELFFKTTLFAINTNRATKTRVYHFLEQESVKNEAVAKMTIRILSSIIGSKTIKDTNHNIDILLAINEVFPNLEIPILIKTIN